MTQDRVLSLRAGSGWWSGLNWDSIYRSNSVCLDRAGREALRFGRRMTMQRRVPTNINRRHDSTW